MTVVPRPNPYLGPRPFRAGEALYGREREVNELLDLLIAERIVLLCSPSGAGKTSLIQAELIPRLQNAAFNVLPIMRVSLEPPPAIELPSGFNRYVLSLLISLEEGLPEAQQTPLAELAGSHLIDYLERIETAANQADNTLLIFDQFEEILTVSTTDHAARLEFFAEIGAVLRDRGRWALFAMREDYRASLDPYIRAIPTRFSTTFRLDLLGPAAAQLAMQEPARHSNVDFTDDAARKLVDDLRRVRVQHTDGTTDDQAGLYVEPVQLQVVCLRLWERMPVESSQIVEADVEAIGNVDSALADYYSERLMAIAAETGIRERAIRDWFDDFLITDQEIRGQVLQSPNISQGLENRVIWRLIDAHLVRGEKRRGANWFELAHDRLIKPVRTNNAAWREANLTILQRQAAFWDAEGRPEWLLLHDQALVEAESWALSHPEELTTVEQDFIAACRKSQIQQRRDQRNNRLIRGLAVVATITMLVALFFFVQARRQTRVALSRQLAAQALNLLDDKLDLALLLSFEANRLADTPEVRGSLLAGLEYSPHLQRFLYTDPGSAPSAVFGRIVAAGSVDGTLTFWDMNTRQRIGRPMFAHTGGVRGFNFDSTGTRLASGGDDSAVRLWNVVTSEPDGKPLLGHTDTVNNVVFSPDGKLLASASVDKQVILWDVATRQLVARLNGHTDEVFTVAFSPDGTILASAGRDRNIMLWDIATHQLIGQPLGGHVGPIAALLFSPDGTLLASGGGDYKVMLWDMSTRKLLGQPLVGHSGWVSSLAFTPDGKTLASGSADKTIVLWDVVHHRQLEPALRGHTNGVVSLLFQPEQTLISGSDDSTAIVWNLADRPSIGTTLTGHTDRVISTAFRPDGLLLASGSSDSTVRLWDTRVKQQRGQLLTGHTAGVNSVAFSPDGQILASASADHTIRLWDVGTSKLLGVPLTGHTDVVRSIVFSPDGKMLASGSRDLSVRIWDVASGQQIGLPLTGHTERVVSVAFSPDGAMVASASWDETIILWNVATRQPIGVPLVGHYNPVLSLAFSPDGKRLASGSASRSIILWDVANHQAIGSPLTRHADWVESVAFSPDGATLASGSGDGTVILWDVATLQPIGNPLTGHVDRVASIAYSSDGATLVSGSWDQSLILWAVSPALWNERACSIAARNLSQQEWKQYIGSTAYRPSCISLP